MLSNRRAVKKRAQLYLYVYSDTGKICSGTRRKGRFRALTRLNTNCKSTFWLQLLAQLNMLFLFAKLTNQIKITQTRRTLQCIVKQQTNSAENKIRTCDILCCRKSKSRYPKIFKFKFYMYLDLTFPSLSANF